MFSRTEPKIRFIITVSAFIAALCVLGVIIFYYAIPPILQESARIAETKTKLATLEEKKGVLLAEEEKIKSLSTNISAVEGAVIPANNPVVFLGVLERLASRKQLTIETALAPQGPDAPQDTLALTVSVTGGLKQEIEFIKNISSLPFVITISRIALSRNTTFVSAETKSNTKIITPLLGDPTITMTIFVASRP